MKTAPPIATPVIAPGRWMGDLVLCATAADGGEFARPAVDDAIHPLDAPDELAGDALSSREPTVMAFVAVTRDEGWAALFEGSAAPAAASSALDSAPRGNSMTDGRRAAWVNATSGLAPCDGNNEDASPCSRTWI